MPVRHFEHPGAPAEEADDVSACDRPYGNSPPRDIASYPFKLNRSDIRKARRQIDAGMRDTCTPAGNR